MLISASFPLLPATSATPFVFTNVLRVGERFCGFFRRFEQSGHI